MYKFVADPYWIKINIVWDTYEGDDPSFVSLGLNKPGTLVEIERTDGKRVQYLLGDLDYYGHNGDFRPFDIEKTMVKRYKVLLECESEDESEEKSNS